MKESIYDVVAKNGFMLAGLMPRYSYVFLVDIDADEYAIVKSEYKEQYRFGKCWSKASMGLCRDFVATEYQQMFTDYIDLSTISDRLVAGCTPEVYIFTSLMSEKWYVCQWRVAECNAEGRATRAFFVMREERVEKASEEALIVHSLARTYTSLFYIDFEADTYTSYYNNFPCSSAAIPVTGKTSDNLEKFWQYLVMPEFRDTMREFLDMSTLNSRLKNKNIISCQFIGIDKPWCEVSFIVCDRNDDGSLSHIIMGIRNIDKQKRAELESINALKTTIEANQSKTMLLQNMSHEIRTPLNAMFGFSQLLSLPDGSFSDQEKSEYFDYIYNSFNMLTMLIDDVLDIADAEHGNYRIEIGDVCVNEVCHNCLQMAEARRPLNVNMYLTSDVDNDYKIKSDGRRIQQVLINYLTNACKHTEEGEIHLHVSTTETPGRLTFSVTDTGTGVPPEMAEGIFERFKKLDNLVQGSGLGLNICSVIAERLNGEVKLDTTYTNGARFVFIL